MTTVTANGTAPHPVHISGQRLLIHISRLRPHPDNIRDDLGDVAGMAASVRAIGILQPLVVTPVPGEPDSYYVLAGHRRLEGARRARLNEVPCVVRADGSQAIQVMLVENCQRADLGPVEKAKAMGALRKQGMTGKQIAAAIGLTDGTVSTYLALLDLDESSQQKVAAGSLPVADAVRAVRKTRAQLARANGHPDQRKATAITWEPDHFTDRHPLARKARALCDAREHNARRRLGGTACGACWETAIRTDERIVSGAIGQAPEAAPEVLFVPPPGE